MDLFSLDPGLTVWTWIAFGILCVILAKWVFPPLLKSIETREKAIAASVDQAALIETRLKNLEQERRDLLAQTQAQAEAILYQARQDGARLRKSLLDKAVLEADDIVVQGRARAAEERQATIEALRMELAEFVLVCAGTIVGSTLTGEKEREWSRQLVKTL